MHLSDRTAVTAETLNATSLPLVAFFIVACPIRRIPFAIRARYPLYS